MHFVIEFSPRIISAVISRMIEPEKMKKQILGLGFFFERNPITDKISLLYRVKYLSGDEHRVIYNDVRYFGLDHEYVYHGSEYEKKSKFIVSNEWQDKALMTGVNFCEKYYSFKYIVEYINDFIQKALVVRAHNAIHAFPMLVTITNHDIEYMRSMQYHASAHFVDDVTEATVVEVILNESESSK
jgi:hypothetical protein